MLRKSALKKVILATSIVTFTLVFHFYQAVTHSVITCNAIHPQNIPPQADMSQQMRAMREVEYKYSEKLAALSPSDIEDLSLHFHRNVTYHWGGKHGVFPASKPLPHKQCLR